MEQGKEGSDDRWKLERGVEAIETSGKKLVNPFVLSLSKHERHRPKWSIPFTLRQAQGERTL